jgi:hypothetical protein
LPKRWVKRRTVLRPTLHSRAVARTRVEISLEIRDLDFNPFEKKRLIDKMRGTVDVLPAQWADA